MLEATVGEKYAQHTNHRQRSFFHKSSTSLIPGGADRDRTGGLLVANQALSQLSYSPNPVVRLWSLVVRKSPSFAKTTNDARPTTDLLVGLDRLELSTSPLSGVRSSHLSYRPGYFPE